MTDIYDQATEIEDMHRRIALENQAARTAGKAAPPPPASAKRGAAPRYPKPAVRPCPAADAVSTASKSKSINNA